jgi:hypothetical protein
MNFAEECTNTDLKCDHVKVPLSDYFSQKLLDKFDVIVELIDLKIKLGHKIYVHCVAGKSRSPSIILAYLMKIEGMNLTDAYAFVKEKRNILPNLGFINELIKYEKILYGKSTFDIDEYTVYFIYKMIGEIVNVDDNTINKIREIYNKNNKDYDATVDECFKFKSTMTAEITNIEKIEKITT